MTVMTQDMLSPRDLVLLADALRYKAEEMERQKRLTKGTPLEDREEGYFFYERIEHNLLVEKVGRLLINPSKAPAGENTHAHN